MLLDVWRYARIAGRPVRRDAGASVGQLAVHGFGAHRSQRDWHEKPWDGLLTPAVPRWATLLDNLWAENGSGIHLDAEQR